MVHGGEFVEAHVLATGLSCIATESTLELTFSVNMLSLSFKKVVFEVTNLLIAVNTTANDKNNHCTEDEIDNPP